MLWPHSRPHCRSSQRCSLCFGLSCWLPHQRQTQRWGNQARSLYSCPGIIILSKISDRFILKYDKLRLFNVNGFMICQNLTNTVNTICFFFLNKCSDQSGLYHHYVEWDNQCYWCYYSGFQRCILVLFSLILYPFGLNV